MNITWNQIWKQFIHSEVTHSEFCETAIKTFIATYTHVLQAAQIQLIVA